MPVKIILNIKKQISNIKLNNSVLSCLVFLIFGFGILDFDCYAAPCYGTTMPEQKEFFMGLQSYSLLNRYLEDEKGKVRSTQNFLLLSYGVFDWLAIDLKGGAGNIKQRPPDHSELDYPYGFDGGYGLRIKFFDKEKIKMVFGFQHISVHPKNIHVDNVKNKAVLDDWQVSLLVSAGFSKFTPYLGTRWSRIDYIHWVEDDRKRVMSESNKQIGLICGVDVPLTEKIWLNIEGQFLDSEAVAGSINYRF